MSAGLPKALTRGYSHAFTTMLKEAAAKALTIKDLKDLDDADLEREASIARDNEKIGSEDAVH